MFSTIGGYLKGFTHAIFFMKFEKSKKHFELLSSSYEIWNFPYHDMLATIPR